MRTIGMLLGIPEQDQEAIRDRLDSGMRLKEGAPPDPNDTLVSLADEAFAEYIDWRAEHPSDDLMTELLNAEFEDHTGVTRTLSREEILGYVGLLAGAGNETTTRLIGWMGKLLAENPGQRRKVVEDRTLVPNTVEELLRFEAPSPVQSRYISHDVEHYGQKIEAGNVMVLLTAAGNHDERHFPDPDRFDIEREIDHHLSFGYGIHFCLGAALARLEGRVALDEVLNRFPEWDVDWDARRAGAHQHRARLGEAAGADRVAPGSAPQEREQAQHLEVDPHQRHHDAERAVPLHVLRRAVDRRLADELVVEEQVQRCHDTDHDADDDPERGRLVPEHDVDAEEGHQTRRTGRGRRSRRWTPSTTIWKRRVTFTTPNT